MTSENGLRSAYKRCARMQLRHDPTFFWATRRLPADVRPAVHALYGYVRSADEVVDGPRRAKDPAQRRAQLDAWERALKEARANGGADHPVIAALVDAGERHDLPLDELDVYMRSMRVDCDRVRIATREELDAYMDGSAAAVGRIMAPLLGAPAHAATWRGSASPSSSRTSSATSARTGGWTGSTSPACRSATWPSAA